MLQKTCSPILNQFENDAPEYYVRPLNRKIVLAIGVLMTFLAGITFYIAYPDKLSSYFLPPLIFFAVGFTALVVGCLGSDKAVAKLIGSKR